MKHICLWVEFDYPGWTEDNGVDESWNDEMEKSLVYRQLNDGQRKFLVVKLAEGDE